MRDRTTTMGRTKKTGGRGTATSTKGSSEVDQRMRQQQGKQPPPGVDTSLAKRPPPKESYPNERDKPGEFSPHKDQTTATEVPQGSNEGELASPPSINKALSPAQVSQSQDEGGDQGGGDHGVQDPAGQDESPES